MAPRSNLLVRNINMEREASCEPVLSEANWLGGDVATQQMLNNGPPSTTLTRRALDLQKWADAHQDDAHNHTGGYK